MESKLKAGTVTYRRLSSGEVLILSITASAGGHWILPMGKVKSGESLEAAAVRETEEEAGVLVDVRSRIGALEWENLSGQRQKVDFYLAAYLADTHWPERGKRSRRWMLIEDAAHSGLAPDFQRIVVAAQALLREHIERT